jgi:hypothetical protein
MRPPDPTDEPAILSWIKALIAGGRYRYSDHARGRLLDRDVTPAELAEAILGSQLLENYPTYFTGPACLLYGDTAAGRPLHIVCSTTLPEVVIITVYEPSPPKWLTPTRRSET